MEPVTLQYGSYKSLHNSNESCNTAGQHNRKTAHACMHLEKLYGIKTCSQGLITQQTPYSE